MNNLHESVVFINEDRLQRLIANYNCWDKTLRSLHPEIFETITEEDIYSLCWLEELISLVSSWGIHTGLIIKDLKNIGEKSIFSKTPGQKISFISPVDLLELVKEFREWLGKLNGHPEILSLDSLKELNYYTNPNNLGNAIVMIFWACCKANNFSITKISTLAHRE